MVLLQHPCYLITFILTKTQASLSSHQQDAIRSLSPGLALIQERDPIDFTHFEPVDFLAAKSDSDTPSDENPSEVTFDQTQLEGDNFVPSQSTLISAFAPVAEPNKRPVDNSQDSALLPWDENGGVPLLIPNLPSLSLPSFPNANQDSENKIKEGIRPEKEPDCDDKLFSFCCESGPPILKVNSGTSAERIEEIDTERKQRLRGCVKWDIDHPACQFPENEACCVCLSLRRFAFFCYNPHWRADPNYNGMPQPPPHPISKPEPEIDPAPAEPNPNASPEKRGIEQGDYSDLLYAARWKPPSRPPREMWRYPGSKPPPEYMCSNEFMETTGVKPSRIPRTRKFTPENPWEPKPPEPVTEKTPEERKKPPKKAPGERKKPGPKPGRKKKKRPPSP